MDAKEIEAAVFKASPVVDEDNLDDVVLYVYQTLLIKEFEDDSEGNVTLHGTLIQRVLNPPTGFTHFTYRVNDKDANGAIELRRTRAANFFSLKGHSEDEGNQLKGIASTFNVSLPMKGRPITKVNYPFKVIELSVTLEMSSTALDGKQYRPSLVFPKDKELRNFISFKVNRLKEGDKESCFDIDAIEHMRVLDYFRLKPYFIIPKEEKKQVKYFPKLTVGIYAEIPWIRNIITTTIPTTLLILMLWLNWYLHIHKDDKSSTYSDYFSNSLTIVLALVVLIPALQDSSVGRTKFNFVEGMIVLMFLGTGIASNPDWAFAGNGIASLGLLCIIFPILRYVWVKHRVSHLNTNYSFSDFVKKDKKDGDKKVRGEDVDLDVWRAKPDVIEHLSYMGEYEKKIKEELNRKDTNSRSSSAETTVHQV